MKYVSAKEAKKYFQISGQTLKLWKDQNKIQYQQFSPHKILYDIDSKTNDVILQTDNIDTRKNVIYARVSCTNQKQSLDNQIELIKSYMLSKGIQPDEIYSEIASGLNDNRKELNRLLEDVVNDKVDRIIIWRLDRWFRNVADYYRIQDILDKNKLNVLIQKMKN